MANQHIPCPTVLRQLLRYDPETGKLFWKPRSALFFKDGKSGKKAMAAAWNAKYAGTEAFSGIHIAGYKKGALFDAQLLAHRVIWTMIYGSQPIADIDHINGVKTDNRLENLRSVSHLVNGRNCRKHNTNTSGMTGVGWHKRAKKWVASITVNNKSVHLGLFECPDDAVSARKAAEVRHGFHENHGRTA